MNKQTLSIILLLFSFQMLSAQKDTSDTDVFGFFFTFSSEVPFINSEALDLELGQNGFPTLNQPKVAFGWGVQLYTNRMITSFSFNKKTIEEEQDDFLTEVGYRSTNFSVGYDLTKNYKRHFYPYVGFKGYGVNYISKEKIPDGTNFQDFLNLSNSYKEMNYSRFSLDLGFGISFQRFLLVNLKGGYLLPLEKANWTINNTDNVLLDVPALDYKYYFTLVLGLGGVEKEEDIKPLEQRRERRNRSVMNRL